MLDVFELLPFSCLLPDNTITFYSMLIATAATPVILVILIIIVVKVMLMNIQSRINYDIRDDEEDDEMFDQHDDASDPEAILKSDTSVPGVDPTDPSSKTNKDPVVTTRAKPVVRKEGELSAAEANEKCTELTNAATRGVLILLFLAYPVLTNKLLQVFDCRLIEGTYYLTQDVDEVCFDSAWLPYGMLGHMCLHSPHHSCLVAQVLLQHSHSQ